MAHGRPTATDLHDPQTAQRSMSSHELLLKAMLQQRLAELTARLREQRVEMQTECTAPGRSRPGEESGDPISDDVAVAMIETTNRTIRLLENALVRLEQGVYGNCADCGEAIAPARLIAMPFASRCRACESSREASTRHNTGRRSMAWSASLLGNDER
jgi:RNA polymerase-binding transcription factor DksA